MGSDGPFLCLAGAGLCRHSYLRQFAPAFQVEPGNPVANSLMEAVQVLRQMNEVKRYKLPDDVPIDFIPKKWRAQVIPDEGTPNKAAWECALLTRVRDQVKSGNLSVQHNYAPFFSVPHECSDRDAPFVLDGLLYNESDLAIEEHYTDTHGFTDINFTAFTLLGKSFIPRIKALHKYAIFRIDPERDYGALTRLVDKKDRTLNLGWIIEQWDRMGHFYASLENVHVTASTALRRLNGFTGKNHFYRANRELGRLLRTEHTLSFMSDPALRQRNRRGLLKGEQIHALARDVKMGKRGGVNTRDRLEQRHSCSCLTLVMACIIYWQAKEINRVLQEHTPDDSIDLSMVKHISPIAWENIILYGDYILNREKVKV